MDDREKVMSDFVKAWSRFKTESDTEFRAALETLHKKLNEIEAGESLDPDVKPGEKDRLILI